MITSCSHCNIVSVSIFIVWVFIIYYFQYEKKCMVIFRSRQQETVLFIHHLGFYVEIHLQVLCFICFVFNTSKSYFPVVLKEFNQHFSLLDNTVEYTVWMAQSESRNWELAVQGAVWTPWLSAGWWPQGTEENSASSRRCISAIYSFPPVPPVQRTAAGTTEPRRQRGQDLNPLTWVVLFSIGTKEAH